MLCLKSVNNALLCVVNTVFDVSSDLIKRKEMIDKSGQMGVPVILIEDQIIVGFNQPKIMELLDIK